MKQRFGSCQLRKRAVFDGENDWYTADFGYYLGLASGGGYQAGTSRALSAWRHASSAQANVVNISAVSAQTLVEGSSVTVTLSRSGDTSHAAVVGLFNTAYDGSHLVSLAYNSEPGLPGYHVRFAPGETETQITLTAEGRIKGDGNVGKN